MSVCRAPAIRRERDIRRIKQCGTAWHMRERQRQERRVLVTKAQPKRKETSE